MILLLPQTDRLHPLEMGVCQHRIVLLYYVLYNFPKQKQNSLHDGTMFT